MIDDTLRIHLFGIVPYITRDLYPEIMNDRRLLFVWKQ